MLLSSKFPTLPKDKEELVKVIFIPMTNLTQTREDFVPSRVNSTSNLVSCSCKFSQSKSLYLHTLRNTFSPSFQMLFLFFNNILHNVFEFCETYMLTQYACSLYAVQAPVFFFLFSLGQLVWYFLMLPLHYTLGVGVGWPT